MNVYAVVLNWRSPDETLSCIKSLQNQKLPNGVTLSIIVVDNASPDDSAIKLGSIKSITFLQNTRNDGYAGGNNVGIRYALSQNPDYIWVLNPDLVLDKYVLGKFIEFFQEHSSASLLSPKIYFSPGHEFHKSEYQKKDLGKVILYAGGNINWSTVLGEHIGVDQVDRGQFAQPHRIEFATGTSVFVRPQVFEDIGLFDERYFMYLEDLDFSYRATQAGFEIWFVPAAKIWHKNASTSKVGGFLHDYYFSRNRLLFGLTHGSFRLKFALIRESIRLLLKGRKWQRRGIIDFYVSRFGAGSYR